MRLLRKDSVRIVHELSPVSQVKLDKQATANTLLKTGAASTKAQEPPQYLGLAPLRISRARPTSSIGWIWQKRRALVHRERCHPVQFMDIVLGQGEDESKRNSARA